MPETGDTENIPDVGGALVTTTTDEELDAPVVGTRHVSVNVSVDPLGREFAESTKKSDEGDEDDTLTLVGMRDAAPRSKNESSIDHTAWHALTPWGRDTVALSTSIVEGSILGLFTLDTTDTKGLDASTTLTITTSRLDLEPVASWIVSVIWLEVPEDPRGAVTSREAELEEPRVTPHEAEIVGCVRMHTQENSRPEAEPVFPGTFSS
jgi:hypothetical protein